MKCHMPILNYFKVMKCFDWSNFDYMFTSFTGGSNSRKPRMWIREARKVLSRQRKHRSIFPHGPCLTLLFHLCRLYHWVVPVFKSISLCLPPEKNVEN